MKHSLQTVTNQTTAKCPKCGKKPHYDSFEDMYCCLYCDIHYEPDEVGMPENRDALIYHLNDKVEV